MTIKFASEYKKRFHMSNIYTIYFAPLEGITLAPFRNVHQEFFPGISKYFTPFLVANQTLHFKNGEKRDIVKENNTAKNLIPQILSNKAEEFIWAVREIASYGYQEININLGCPSPTVTARGKGAGFLRDLQSLDAFLEKAFEALENTGVALSAKTRIGMDEKADIGELIAIYNRYPFKEIIVHPRIGRELYRGTPDREAFDRFIKECRHPLCYNGDINGPSEMKALFQDYPTLPAVMCGRGLIRDPAMAREALGGAPLTKEEAKRYVRALEDAYAQIYPDSRHIVSKMKEIWFYMADLCPESEKIQKKMKKSRTLPEFQNAEDEMFFFFREEN